MHAKKLMVDNFVQADHQDDNLLLNLLVLHEGTWWQFAYGSVFLFVCLIVCLIGAGNK